MLAIEITLNIFSLPGIFIIAFLAGFLLRGARLTMLKKKVNNLEKEMLDNHAEILELQKERAALLNQMKESKIPVIAINGSKEENELHDVSMRKMQAGQKNL